MSGSIQFPTANALPGLVANQSWGISNAPITAITLDSPLPAPAGGKTWFTGFTVGGLLNPQAATLVGSTTGSHALLSYNNVRDFSVDEYGNFAWSMNATGQNETFVLTQNGVSSPATVAQVVTSWNPLNLTTPGPGCMLWWDAQDPTCTRLNDRGNAPHVSALINKATPYSFLTLLGKPLPTLGRGGSSGKTRVLLMNTNPSNTNPFDGGVANWAASYLGDGSGHDNLIRMLNTPLGGFPSTDRTVVMAVRNAQVPLAGASQTYANFCIWNQIPCNASEYEQIRANFGSGVPTGYNPAWASSNGIIGAATAVTNPTNYTVTATSTAGGSLVFRVNGTQTGAAVAGAASVALTPQVFGLGVNNLPAGTPGLNYPNGVPFAQHAFVAVWNGVLSAGDITSAEAWANASVA